MIWKQNGLARASDSSCTRAVASKNNTREAVGRNEERDGTPREELKDEFLGDTNLSEKRCSETRTMDAEKRYSESRLFHGVTKICYKESQKS